MEEKECPKCQTKHHNKGRFCSKSCAQSRTYTKETIELKKKRSREYFETPEGIAFKERQRKRAVCMNTGQEYVEILKEDIPIDIPTIIDMDDVRDFLHGDFKFGDTW